jgi:uncharacterized protein YqeY
MDRAMELRERVTEAMKEAMRAKDTARLSTIRLITAAIKDREIALRASSEVLGESDVLALLGKMVKQRQESAKIYTEGARPELAAKELAEVAVIEEFLPKALAAAQTTAAIEAAITGAGATSLRDMGKVMAILKEKYTGQMDFGAAGALVKARLA